MPLLLRDVDSDMKTEAQKLREAKALISDPKRWCQGSYGKTADGEITLAKDPKAVAWCAVGACKKVGAMSSILLAAADVLCEESDIYVNDTLGHEATLEMFDLAIELAEKEL